MERSSLRVHTFGIISHVISKMGCQIDSSSVSPSSRRPSNLQNWRLKSTSQSHDELKTSIWKQVYRLLNKESVVFLSAKRYRMKTIFTCKNTPLVKFKLIDKIKNLEFLEIFFYARYFPYCFGWVIRTYQFWYRALFVSILFYILL